MLRSFLFPGYSTLSELERMSKELRSAFEPGNPVNNIRGSGLGGFPAVDVFETPDNVMVFIYAPGIDPGGLELTIEKNVLTVEALRDTIKDVGEGADPGSFYRRERFSGRFKRVIALPDSVNPDAVEARYENGVIEVTIGKREDEKARKIAVSIE